MRYKKISRDRMHPPTDFLLSKLFNMKTIDVLGTLIKYFSTILG